MTKLDKPRHARLRRHMQMIFQDPYSSLNPRMTVRDIIAEPLVASGLARRHGAGRPRRDSAAPLPASSSSTCAATRTPSAAASGSASASRARWWCEPEFIVCDEAVSALDVSIQAQILNLLKDAAEANLG